VSPSTCRSTRPGLARRGLAPLPPGAAVEEDRTRRSSAARGGGHGPALRAHAGRHPHLSAPPLPCVSLTDARATEPAPRTARGLPPASTVALAFAAAGRRIRACAAPDRRPECARFICGRGMRSSKIQLLFLYYPLVVRSPPRPPVVAGARAVSERVPLALRLGKAANV
jgi:hypothetical protein